MDVSGGELIAVSRFEGYITPAAAEEARQKLIKALARGVCGVCVCLLSCCCCRGLRMQAKSVCLFTCYPAPHTFPLSFHFHADGMKLSQEAEEGVSEEDSICVCEQHAHMHHTHIRT